MIHDDTVIIVRTTVVLRRFRAHVYDCGRSTERTDRQSAARTRLTFTHATRNGFPLPPSHVVTYRDFDAYNTADIQINNNNNNSNVVALIV